MALPRTDALLMLRMCGQGRLRLPGDRKWALGGRVGSKHPGPAHWPGAACPMVPARLLRQENQMQSEFVLSSPSPTPFTKRVVRGPARDPGDSGDGVAESHKKRQPAPGPQPPVQRVSVRRVGMACCSDPSLHVLGLSCPERPRSWPLPPGMCPSCLLRGKVLGQEGRSQSAGG